ncbi:MAG: universal stress protein [Dehalococcoidia bacterium]
MKVLVPLDGSRRSSSILPAARRLVELVPGTEVHLVTVLNPESVRGRLEHPADSPRGGEAGTLIVEAPRPRTAETHGQAIERHEHEMREWLDEVFRSTFPGTEQHCHVEWDDEPARAITRLADRLGVDLIAMATHGRAGLSHLVVGSVTERVLRTARQPVLAAGPQIELPQGG